MGTMINENSSYTFSLKCNHSSKKQLKDIQNSSYNRTNQPCLIWKVSNFINYRKSSSRFIHFIAEMFHLQNIFAYISEFGNIGTGSF